MVDVWAINAVVCVCVCISINARHGLPVGFMDVLVQCTMCVCLFFLENERENQFT